MNDNKLIFDEGFCGLHHGFSEACDKIKLGEILWNFGVITVPLDNITIIITGIQNSQILLKKYC